MTVSFDESFSKDSCDGREPFIRGGPMGRYRDRHRVDIAMRLVLLTRANRTSVDAQGEEE
jgi:hypothetical protein